MAAPKKTGLSEYLVDVGYERDIKMLAAKEAADPKRTHPNLRFITPLMYQYICAEVMAQGYIADWDEETEIQFAAKHEITIETVRFYVGIFLKVGLFSQDMFTKYGALTSGEIQVKWHNTINKLLRRKAQIAKEHIVPISNLRKKQGLIQKKPAPIPAVIHTNSHQSTKQPSEKQGVSSEETGINSEVSMVSSELTGVNSEETQPANHYRKYLDNNNNTKGLSNTVLKENTIGNTNVVVEVVNSEETPISSEQTPVNSEETMVNSEETPISSEQTPVNSEETMVNSEETPISSELMPVPSEYTPMAILPIEKCLEEFLTNPTMEMALSRVYAWGGWLRNSDDDALIRRWAMAYNRYLEISSVPNKQLGDWGKHFFLWLGKQDISKNPDTLNSTHKQSKQGAAKKSKMDTSGMSQEEIDAYYNGTGT